MSRELKEGRAFAKIAPNIVVKVPMSEKASRRGPPRREWITTNCPSFTANRASCGQAGHRPSRSWAGSPTATRTG